MVLSDVIPIGQHSMSIYTFLGGCVMTAFVGYLHRKSESHDARIGSLEVDGRETNTIVKRIDENMDNVLSNAQQLNTEVITHLLKEK